MDCRFHPKNLHKSNKRTFLAQKVRGHVETTYWSLHGDIRFLLVTHVRYQANAKQKNENCSKKIQMGVARTLMYSFTLNTLIALNKFFDAFPTTVWHHRGVEQLKQNHDV